MSVKLFKKCVAIIGLVALAGVAGCTSSGENSVLGSATKPGSHNDPENPTQRTRLANTRTELTDYCPKVTLREGTGTYRIYKKRASRENTDGLRYQATILKVARDCTYAQGQLNMKIGVSGRVINGPSGETGRFKMPLRVAIKVAGELVYSKLHKPEGSITPGANNGQFIFVDDQISFPAPPRRNVRIFVGFDEGPYKTP